MNTKLIQFFLKKEEIDNSEDQGATKRNMDTQPKCNSKINILYYLIGVSLFYFLSGSIINPILPLYIVNVGASKFQLGLIMAVPGILAIMIRIPIGIISDRVRRWPFIPISLLTASISYVLYSIASNVNWLYPIIAFAALAQIAFAPSAFAIIADLAPSGKRGEITGKYLSTIGFSMTIGPLITSILIKYLSYRQTFLLSAILPLFGLILFFITRLQVKLGAIHQEREYRPQEKKIRFTINIKKIIKSRRVAIVCFATLLWALAMLNFDTFFPVYAEENHHFSPSIISLLFMTKGITNALVRPYSGKMADKIGRKKPLLISFALIILVYAIISLTGNIFILTITLMVFGLGHGMRAVTSVTLLGESVQPDNRTMVMVMYFLMFDLGRVVGPIIFGMIASILPMAILFKSSVIILILAIPALWYL